MGIVIGLVAIAILAIIGLIFYEYISEGFDSFKTEIVESEASEAYQIIPEENQEVCNLRLTVYGEIEYELFSIPVELRFEFGENTNNPQVVVYEWKGCKGTENLSIYDYIEDAELQSLINVVETDFTMKLRLVDNEKNNEEKSRKCCEIPQGIVATPMEFYESFIFNDIPKKNYDLEIIIDGQKINNKITNSPYIYKIRI